MAESTAQSIRDGSCRTECRRVAAATSAKCSTIVGAWRNSCPVKAPIPPIIDSYQGAPSTSRSLGASLPYCAHGSRRSGFGRNNLCPHRKTRLVVFLWLQASASRDIFRHVCFGKARRGSSPDKRQPLLEDGWTPALMAQSNVRTAIGARETLQAITRFEPHLLRYFI